MIELKSKQDCSVNFVSKADQGYHESRFVRRTSEYFICYLSSHNGCNKACRFCHLTATGQTMMVEATVEELVYQAIPVFEHYAGDNPSRDGSADFVNFNFMARGEPLSSSVILNDWSRLYGSLEALAASYGLPARYNVSTIMPMEIAALDLHNVFGDTITPYYSLYSMREHFRKRWLPKSLDPMLALQKLKDWQDKTNRVVVLHWAFIENQNDDCETISEIIDAVNSIGLRVRFNAVRYNPFSSQQGREPDSEIVQRNFDLLSAGFGNPLSHIVPRVGHDIKASCGMFIQGKDLYETS